MIENVIYLEQVYKVAKKTSINRKNMNAIGISPPNSTEIILCGSQKKITDIKENMAKRCEYLTPEEDLVFACMERNIPLKGMNLYTPWGLSTLAFRYAVLFGVSKVVVHKKAMDLTKGKKLYRTINKYLSNHGIDYVEFDGDVGCNFDFTVNGKTFIP